MKDSILILERAREPDALYFLSGSHILQALSSAGSQLIEWNIWKTIDF